MSGKQATNLAGFCFLALVFSLFLLPYAVAQQKARPKDRGQEAAASQAQATMASLFGRGAKMPSIPRASGTIALPAFDNSGMTIEENALRQAQRGERSSGNGKRNS
ncbi:MAG: hypothetical protein A2351_03960 [Omnitrophica bacterium RIFOXYB12_FULL_50_7]|nr:MAG: hypothetical protein A2351_03960 [Omnitrophica bacterium RIFOXYB12_FULL_50_7]